MDGDSVWTPPLTVTSSQRQEAVAYLRAVRQAMPEAGEVWLRGRVFTLLAHYFAASTNDGLNAAVAADWVDSLSVFPEHCIDQACAHWRDNETRKPKPADIRKLAIRFFGELEWEKLQRLKIIASRPVDDSGKGEKQEESWKAPTEDQKQKVRKIMESLITGKEVSV